MAEPIDWENLHSDAFPPSGSNRGFPILIFVTNRVLTTLAFLSFPLGIVLGLALNLWSH